MWPGPVQPRAGWNFPIDPPMPQVPLSGPQKLSKHLQGRSKDDQTTTQVPPRTPKVASKALNYISCVRFRF